MWENDLVVFERTKKALLTMVDGATGVLSRLQGRGLYVAAHDLVFSGGKPNGGEA